MPKAVQFSVGLDNAAGTLAKLCAALRKARVNIEAISVSDNADCGWVRMIATPARKAREALHKGKYVVCAQLVVTVTAQNRPGELERITQKLARAGVNVNYVYGSSPAAAKSMLVFGVSDVERAAGALDG